MVKQTLPCAEKGCKSKMRLTETTDNILYYNCVQKHEKHAFRYNIEQQRWEKIILNTKRIFNYNENPCEETTTGSADTESEYEKVTEQAQPKAAASNLTNIKHVFSKTKFQGTIR